MIEAYPSTYSPEQITEALKDPGNSEYMLASASAGLSATQYLYYKILREASDIPMFKHYIIPPELSKSEYLSDKFKDEEEFVCKWINALNPVVTFKKMAMEVKREGKATYVFRQCIESINGKLEPKYVVFQKLPAAYTKLTALGQYGYVASFNMLLFLQPAYSPEQYPEYIQKIWAALIDNNFIVKDKRGRYSVDYKGLQDARLNIDGRTIIGNLELSDIKKRTYMYWVQLPSDLCYTFASDMSTAIAAPDTMGLFTSLQELTDYSTLAGLVQSTPLTAILTGQAEFITNSQAGQDQTEISPSTLSALQNAFDNMVSGNIQAFFAPLKDLKLQSLPNVPNGSDIKTKALQNFISSAGESGLISASEKPPVAMIKGAQLAAESQYDFVTQQFARAVNSVLNKFCELKYLWRVVLWGGIYTFENQVKIMKEMVASGATFLLPKLASAYDLDMKDVNSISTYIDATGVYDKFKTLSQSQNQAQGTGEVGRPSLDDSEIDNDNTAASRETGGDISELKNYDDEDEEENEDV